MQTPPVREWVGSLQFATFVISCRRREPICAATLRSLATSDWESPPTVILDDETGEDAPTRIERTWKRALELGEKREVDFLLFLEDDVAFCRYFQENVFAWSPLRRAAPSESFYASLYNPNSPWRRGGLPRVYENRAERFMVVPSDHVWGSQAIVVTRRAVRFVLEHWDEAPGMPDARMPKLLRAETPICYHVPSLVQHVGVASTWGGVQHRALDFDPALRADTIAREPVDVGNVLRHRGAANVSRRIALLKSRRAGS